MCTEREALFYFYFFFKKGKKKKKKNIFPFSLKKKKKKEGNTFANSSIPDSCKLKNRFFLLIFFPVDVS